MTGVHRGAHQWGEDDRCRWCAIGRDWPLASKPCPAACLENISAQKMRPRVRKAVAKTKEAAGQR